MIVKVNSIEMINTKKEKKFFIRKDLYTTLPEAKKEIWRRWNDKELRKKVEDFLGGDVPKFFKNNPKAVLARYIASPNHDTHRFLALSKETGLSPVIFEHVNDKLYAGNTDKYHLCKLFFFNGIGKKGGLKLDTFRAVDFCSFEGKKIKEVDTIMGSKLVDFHHEMLIHDTNGISYEIHDVDGWYERNGRIPEKYYYRYLSLFLCFGILFENFLDNEEEQDFTNNIVLKNFNKIFKKFKIKPLIVPVTPFEDEKDIYWWCYPQRLINFIKNKNGF